jgi:hypothetical protein
MPLVGSDYFVASAPAHLKVEIRARCRRLCHRGAPTSPGGSSRLEISCPPPRAPDWRRRGVRGLRVLPRGDCVHVGLQPHRPGDEAVTPGARRMGRFDDAWLHRCVRGHRSLRPAHGRAAAVRLAGSAPLTVWRGASRRRLGSRHPVSPPNSGSGAGVRRFMSVWLTDP